MKIAAGLICWQDGHRCLERCVDSLAQVVDVVLLANGRIEGVPSLDLPDTDDVLPEWIKERHPGLDVRARQQLWRNHTDQIDWVLQEARRENCDWLLNVAGDEELCRPELLRPLLEKADGAYWPLPFFFNGYHSGEGQLTEYCPSKLLRVSDWQRSLSGSNVFLHENGGVYSCIGCIDYALCKRLEVMVKDGLLPFLDHHPELRPPGRASLRMVNMFDKLNDPIPAAQPWLAL